MPPRTRWRSGAVSPAAAADVLFQHFVTWMLQEQQRVYWNAVSSLTSGLTVHSKNDYGIVIILKDQIGQSTLARLAIRAGAVQAFATGESPLRAGVTLVGGSAWSTEYRSKC